MSGDNSGSNERGKKRKSSGGGGSAGGGTNGGNGFKALGLSEPVFRAIVRMGFRMPTPVQRRALPVVLTGADACVMARTGSGKTCAFLIPLLEKLIKADSQNNANNSTRPTSARALILSPTRELSIQTLKVLNKLAHFTELTAVGIHGGEGMEKQFDMLASKPDIIVATPGRLAHHLSEIPDFNLSHCLMCILDEADRLMEMGFASQIREIGRTMPEHCQKVLLSATMPKILVEFSKTGFCTDPEVVRLDQECSVSEELRIAFITCRSADKDAALLHVMAQIQQDVKANESLRTGLTLVFAATRHHVEYIHHLMGASGISSTLVYGTLDQEARKSNLAAFRSGRKPVLIVTDVAARGIDVPLIDHVIHYHFPANAKLFVHRSGRAARAGRIGYCWGLIDPEEMPYMIDLHLFLGRRAHDGINEDGTELAYTLSEMTPEMVHYGALPVSILTQEVENVQRLINAEMTGSQEAESLRALAKVCNNAMKQYRRTRPEASRDAVRRAKAILEGERLETGERVGGGKISTHPLLRGMEQKMRALGKETKTDVQGLQSADNFRKCEDLLKAISEFRPKETVFEAFATGVGKDTAVASQVDKGRTTNTKKSNSAVALTAMKNMRRQMRVARGKGATLVVAGSATAQKLNGDVSDEEDDQDDEDDTEAHERPAPMKVGDACDEGQLSPKGDKTGTATTKVLANAAIVAPTREGKRFLSKAGRRRQAKAKKSAISGGNGLSASNAPVKPKTVQRDFRDPAFYIENEFNENQEKAQRSRQIELAMQPSAALKGIAGAAFRLEEAMLDVVGDENEELVQKQRMMRWDKSKRKYVKTTVGAELSGDSKSKKMRLESGQLVKSDKAKLGELYVKWQKKTNRSVGRTGVFDDGPASSSDGLVHRATGRGKNGDSLKSSKEIKKEREKKENIKVKNMKKGDRRRLEQQQRKAGREKSSTDRAGKQYRGKGRSRR